MANKSCVCYGINWTLPVLESGEVASKNDPVNEPQIEFEGNGVDGSLTTLAPAASGK